ncbi:MAG: peptidylprolyl isomerase [Candidatus Eremiobacterota bacterium]
MGSLFKPRESCRCSHILVPDEATARTLHQKLQEGADFAALAREHSQCPSGKASGGDLGTFQKGSMVPAFENVAFKLEVGQLSEPVQTKFGYHLIKRTG